MAAQTPPYKVLRNQITIPEGDSFRAKAELPPGNQVEILEGFFRDSDGEVVRIAGTTISFNPRGGGAAYRWDAVVLRESPVGTPIFAKIEGNDQSGAVAEFDGAPGNLSGTPVGVALTQGDQLIAYVLIEEAATVVISDDDVHDMRGFQNWSSRPLADAGDLAADAGTAVPGSVQKALGADHRHPANVDATLPTALAFGSSGASGASDVSSRNDHEHPMPSPVVAAAVVQASSIITEGDTGNPDVSDLLDLDTGDLADILLRAEFKLLIWLTSDNAGNHEYGRGEYHVTVSRVGSTVFATVNYNYSCWRRDLLGNRHQVAVSTVTGTGATLTLPTLTIDSSAFGADIIVKDLEIQNLDTGGMVTLAWSNFGTWDMTKVSELDITATGHAEFVQ